MTDTSESDLGKAIAAYHEALSEVVKGNAAPLQRLFSRRDDVTVANPWGPARLGWAEVEEALAAAASQFRDGGPQPTPHETLALHTASDLACLVQNERWQAKVGGRDELSPFELRVTSVFRREDGEWKTVHRHADPITVPNPDGVLGRQR